MSNDGPSVIASTVTLNLGPLLSTRGSLMNIENKEEKKETSMFMITPCQHHSRVGQFYRPKQCSCMPTDSPDGWTTGRLLKGKEVNGKTVVMTAEEVTEAKASALPKNTIDLMVCDAHEFESNTWPTGNSYWLEPEGSDNGYAALVTITADRGRAVYGRMVLRSEHLYRLVSAPQGGLILQECLPPQQLWHFEPKVLEVREKDAVMAQAFADAMTEPFDPDAVRSTVAEQMRELIAAKQGEEVVTSVIDGSTAPASEVDLSTVLQMALAAAQARKAS